MIKLLRENRRFVIGVFLLFVFRASFADHYLVPSGSMEPTLLPGDRVVVDKRAYGLRIPLTEVKLTDGKAVARGAIRNRPLGTKDGGPVRRGIAHHPVIAVRIEMNAAKR